jgi:hypothetical protein
VMSLKTIPGSGKSGMSRTRAARSTGKVYLSDRRWLSVGVSWEDGE